MAYTLIVRSIIIYAIVLFLMRMMGKRQLGEMQPYELVITLVVADLATIPMADIALPLIHGVIPLLTLGCIHYILALLERKSLFFRKVINGKPVILINPNGIDYRNLKKCNMNFNDLQEALRTNGNFAIEEVLYAVMQTNGTLSILPRAPYAPLNANTMKIDVDEASLPIIVLAEGKLIKENAKLAKIDENFILEETKSLGYKSLNELLIVTLSNTGTLYVQGKSGKFQTKDTDFQGDW